MQSSLTSDEADEIARAEQRVAERKAELSRSLRRVGESSEQLARRLTRELRPAVTVAIAVAGAAGATALAVALVRRARARKPWFTPQEPSSLAVAAKTAGLWALRMIARRVAQEMVARLNEPAPVAPRSAQLRPGPAE
jgi:hypothetical protein